MPFSRAGPLFPFLSLGGTWRPFFADDRSRSGSTHGLVPRPDADHAVRRPGRKDWEMRFGLPHEADRHADPGVSLGSVSDSRPDPAVFRIHGRDVVSPVDMPRVFGYTPAEPAAPAPLSLVAAIAPSERRRRRRRCSCTPTGSTTSGWPRTGAGRGPALRTDRPGSRAGAAPRRRSGALRTVRGWARASPVASRRRPISSSSRTCRGTSCWRSRRRSASTRHRCRRPGASSMQVT